MLQSRYIAPLKLCLFAFDLGATVFTAFLAVWLVDSNFASLDWWNFKACWFLFPLTAAIIFYIFSFYDQMWAFASLLQYAMLGAGSLIQAFFVTMLMQLMNKHLHLVTMILYTLLLMAMIAGSRIAYRLFYNYMGRRQAAKKGWRPAQVEPAGASLNVLVVGAGVAGNQIIRELQERQTLRRAVAIVDDNPQTHGYKNLDVPVMGGRDLIPELVQRYHIDEIILAIPSAKRSEIQKILRICNQTRAKIRTVPFLPEVLSGKAQLSDLRDVDIEDLLGREPVHLDTRPICENIRQKVVLVTGGGGSIGSELARQIVSYEPRTLILFDIYENNVYELQQEIKSECRRLEIQLEVLIGSVRDRERLEQIFSSYRPDLVFHAAAHKHVPLMEDSREEAVKNNIFGTRNVAEMAGRYGAKKFTLISTDKAVNPTNCMGASKRLAEMQILAMNRLYPETFYVAVRFGNVLGSAGSVIPLFKKQIKEERRVTVTDLEIKRYFMTIPEAAGLVLQASTYAKGGEIFILDMGEPVKIVDLATELIRLSGFEPGSEVPIEVIGLRPGEKQFEELFLDKENSHRTAHDKIYVLQQIQDRASLQTEMKGLMDLIATRRADLESLCDDLLRTICQA